MGPINNHWYQERNLEFGSAAAGRIDIYGLDESEYYGGMFEYALPPMTLESWGQFSDWIDDLETEGLWPYDKLISEFELQNGGIEWIKES